MTERISEAELVVMEALWARAPQTATLLSRLLAKNIIAADQDDRRFLYRSLAAREAYVAFESGRLVNRLFGGRVSPLVAQAASQDQLTAEDIAELEEILRGLRS